MISIDRNRSHQLRHALSLTMFLFFITSIAHLPLMGLAPVLAQDNQGQVYIVQSDDTLWKVAEKYLGDGNRFGDIIAATRSKRAEDPTFTLIEDPGLIFSGSKLWIPSPTVPMASTSPVTPSKPGVTSTGMPAPAAAKPTGSGPTGNIAFSFWNDSPERCTYEINVIDAAACLTSAEACQVNRRIFALNNASEPALSLDGQRLAFRGWGDIPEKYHKNQLDHPYFDCAEPRAERHLGQTTLDGTDYRPTGDYWEDSHPDWSPDGEHLLFDTDRHSDELIRIMMISADGAYEDDFRIVGQQPSWAPDGERFVYRGCDLSGNRCGLWLARALPVEAWDVGLNMIGPLLGEPEAAHPDWSPVSDQIVYQSPTGGSWDLYVINADGSHQRRLTDETGIEGLPAWSPDGQWIAYLSNAEGNWGIWIIRADGSERHRLFSFDGGIFTPFPVEPYFQRDWLDEQISWSR